MASIVAEVAELAIFVTSTIACDGECACQKNYFVDAAGENCIPCAGPFAELVNDECTCNDESVVNDIVDSGLCRCDIENFFYAADDSQG